MDIVHHALIGGAGFLTAAAHDQPLVGASFVAGSVFPDLDVLFMVFGKRFYLHNHQGITHSIILSPVFAALLCIPLWMLPGEQPFLMIWLAALAGLLLHVSLDWFNTYRIELFGPFSKRRFSLDAVFFIDSVALFLTTMFYVLYVVFKMDMAQIIYPLAFPAYFAFKFWLHARVMKKLQPLFAIPSSLNPVEFYILEKRDEGMTGYLYNVLTQHRRQEQRYNEAEDRFQQLAERSQIFNDMKHITRAFHITEVREDEHGTTIIAADLAVRNFGGHFARTELRFDPQGQLIHELANI